MKKTINKKLSEREKRLQKIQQAVNVRFKELCLKIDQDSKRKNIE